MLDPTRARLRRIQRRCNEWGRDLDLVLNRHPLPLPSSSQPNFSRALRATSGLGALVGGNLSRQRHGLQASINATEWVMSPTARRSGGSAGSALESHDPVMNWIDSFGSVRVSMAHRRWSRLVTSTSSSTTMMYLDA